MIPALRSQLPRGIFTGVRSLVAARAYSSTAQLDASKLQVHLTDTPKPKLPNDQLIFGRTFSDHMLEIDWSASSGWEAPTISPYHKLSLDPSSMCLHYASQLFEGMKAYKDKEGRVRLFRPMMNIERMQKSAERIALPNFDKDEMLKCIKEFVKVESNWIPSERGYSLYLRPTMIGTQASLGVGSSSNAKVFLIASPVGPYYRTGFSAVKLFADPTAVRAWPGGSGDSKLGGNYAPGIRTQLDAAAKGYAQVLWLFGPEHYVTEVGTMNCFMLWKNEDGDLELITPPLDGTILPGVTRDSILSLAREWNEFKVSERPFTMPQVAQAAKEGRIVEMFGAGTAAIVSPIKCIHFKGEDINIPLDPSDPTSEAGKLTRRISDTIMGIQYGEIESEWSVVCE